jgi:LysR substrate binding domain
LVLVAADHRLAAPGPISPRDLRDEPMIMLHQPPSADMFREAPATEGVQPLARHTTTHFESVCSLVASGAGYSLLLQRPSSQATYAGPPPGAPHDRRDVRQVDVVLAHDSARVTQRPPGFADFCTGRPADRFTVGSARRVAQEGPAVVATRVCDEKNADHDASVDGVGRWRTNSPWCILRSGRTAPAIAR